MNFGNWNVGAAGIEWTGEDGNTFVIERENITASTMEGATLVYKWILDATEEEWLSQDDLIDLNYAFVFAAARYDAAFDYDTFDATLAEQYDLFEEDEDFDN